VERNEQELVEQCLAGNQDACASLVETYARMVGTVIWRTTGNRDAVDDLAQEAFLRVFKALPYFDGRARLSTWIYTIAHRVAIDQLRKAGRWREEPLALEGDEPGVSHLERRLDSAAIDPESALSRVESGRIVHDALAQLPAEYRVAIEYAAIDGLDYLSIAAMLGVPVGTVKTLVFRGKRMLKEQIEAALRRGPADERSNAL
jgi:RNA polymerase sigma-70 factor (ECF subfamily)